MKLYDLIGIGIGPFNLSLASLAESTTLNTLFLDRRDAFAWHPGMLIPNGQLQVSPLKDCVTLASPTSRFSFLNYLAEHRRLYSFVNKGCVSTSRKEFADYYAWVARQLPNLRFGAEVIDIIPCAEGYEVFTTQQRYHAKAIAFGIGVSPKIPKCARPWLGSSVYHVANFLHQDEFRPGEQVLVVGGGQSGAEVVEHVLGDAAVGRLTWITSRSNFFAMDDNPFVNESFSPAYNQHFQTMSIAQKRMVVNQDHLTSDGISVDLCNRLYEHLYERRINRDPRRSVDIFQSVVMDGLKPVGNRWSVTVKSLTSGLKRDVVVDRVVLATGFQPCPQPFIDKLLTKACVDNDLPVIDENYAVQFNQPMPGPVYLQNRSVVQHGLQSANLSMVAYRNSRIVNNLLGYEHFHAEPDFPMFSDFDALGEVPVLSQESEFALCVQRQFNA